MGAPLAVAIRRRATVAAAVINNGVHTLAECLNATEPIGPADGNVMSSMRSGNLTLSAEKIGALLFVTRRLIYHPARCTSP